MEINHANYNIHDYVSENNATFNEQGFNNIDGAVLTQISNMNLDGMGLDINSGKFLTIGELYENIKNTPEYKSMRNDDKKLLKEMSESNRYKDMVVSNYVHDPVKNNIEGFPSIGKNEFTEQFAAVTITYQQDGQTVNYMSFRATDGSFEGWNEDLLMLASGKTQAQSDSVAYMNIVGKNLSGALTGGGHSKGGNDFEYGYLYCDDDVRDRFISGYLYDSPGLLPELVILNKNYGNFQNLIKGNFLCPQDSIVGQLLHENKDAVFVHSVESGFKEHDLYSWEIDKENNGFVPDSQSKISDYINKMLDAAVMNLDPIERKAVFSFVSFILLNSLDDGDLDKLINYYTNWKNENGEINWLKVLETLKLVGIDIFTNKIIYGDALKRGIGDILVSVILVGTGKFVIEQIEEWVEKNKEKIKNAITKCIDIISEHIKVSINDVRAFFKDVYNSFVNSINSFKNWWDQNLNTGEKYANSNPYICINTTNMHTYANSLKALSNRAKTLDRNMNSLYWHAGFDWNVSSSVMNLGKLLRVGIGLDFSGRLDKCANCLDTTANDFEAAEREISNKV